MSIKFQKVHLDDKPVQQMQKNNEVKADER